MIEYSLSSTMIRVADKLDLFEILYQHGPITCKDLASLTNYNERWLLEILLQLTAQEVFDYNPKAQQFALRSEYAPLLRSPTQEKKSIIGTFQFLSALIPRGEATVEACKTGQGIDYDHGVECIGDALDRKNGNYFRYLLVDDVLSTITIPSTGESLIDKLNSGIDVADIGCGFGTSTVSMAKRFPNSKFYAFESSPRALQAIQNNIELEGVTNVTVCNVDERTIGDGPDLQDPNSMFDFIHAHDVLHDMINPRALIKDVKKRLSPMGCWFIVDIDCNEKIEDNLLLPNSSMLYAFSCLLCLSMATSTPEGEGLGTCGFPSTLAEKWMKKAGFTRFEKRKSPSLPDKACYLVA
jgi:2-polyprenyl-3-methyl-5-hydroxy-6-metoxy-1,4-benzoquinol methylase